MRGARGGVEYLCDSLFRKVARGFSSLFHWRKAVSGLVGAALSCAPGRPNSKASRPHWTAVAKARAMRQGSLATAMAVFTRTASAPISIASAAWLGAPMPASIDDGNGGLFDDDAKLLARFEAAIGTDRRTQRHDRRGADILQAFGENRIGIDIWQHDETFFD